MIYFSTAAQLLIDFSTMSWPPLHCCQSLDLKDKVNGVLGEWLQATLCPLLVVCTHSICIHAAGQADFAGRCGLRHIAPTTTKHLTPSAVPFLTWASKLPSLQAVLYCSNVGAQ